jgi:hypothetical protein
VVLINCNIHTFHHLFLEQKKVDFSLTCADFIALENIFLLSFYLKAPNSVNVNYRLNYLGTHKSHTQTYKWLLTKIFSNSTHCFFFNNSILGNETLETIILATSHNKGETFFHNLLNQFCFTFGIAQSLHRKKLLLKFSHFYFSICRQSFSN